LNKLDLKLLIIVHCKSILELIHHDNILNDFSNNLLDFIYEAYKLLNKIRLEIDDTLNHSFKCASKQLDLIHKDNLENLKRKKWMPFL
jgi:hypothetical protein